MIKCDCGRVLHGIEKTCHYCNDKVIKQEKKIRSDEINFGITEKEDCMNNYECYSCRWTGSDTELTEDGNCPECGENLSEVRM